MSSDTKRGGGGGGKQRGSTRRGNAAKKAPRHKNKFAFKHNKHSRKTKFIANLPTAREQGSGLCVRCAAIIAWRKQYRKYKPMREAHKCATCGERKVTLAYHVICSDCAHAANTCPKCRAKPEELEDDKDPNELDEDDVLEVLSSASLKQRQRRTIMRRFEAGNLTVQDLAKILGEDPKEGDDDDEDDDSGGEHEDEKAGDDDEDGRDADGDDAEAKPKPPKPTAAEVDTTHADDWKVFDDDYDEQKHEALLRARLNAADATVKADGDAKDSKAAPAAAEADSDADADEGEGEGDEGDSGREDEGSDGEGEAEGDADGEGEGDGDDDADGDDADGDGDEGDDADDDDAAASGSSSGAAAAAARGRPVAAASSSSSSAAARGGAGAGASAGGGGAGGGGGGKKAVEPQIDGARLKAQAANKLARSEAQLRAMNAQMRTDKERGRMQFQSTHTHAAMKAKAAAAGKKS